MKQLIFNDAVTISTTNKKQQRLQAKQRIQIKIKKALAFEIKSSFLSFPAVSQFLFLFSSTVFDLDKSMAIYITKNIKRKKKVNNNKRNERKQPKEEFNIDDRIVLGIKTKKGKKGTKKEKGSKLHGNCLG